MTLDTPVAFLIFNRPHLTKVAFEAIAKAKPKKLLVVADGPRFPEEEEKCQKARAAVLDNVDWECEVLTNFSDKNMGCKGRVSSGLDWVFSEVEEAIILEDDCVPTHSFFYFCQTLLEKYRHDDRIMSISGNNFQGDRIVTDRSYYFSKYVHIWGWASWRRAWKYYDVEIKTWPEYKRSGLIRLVCEDSYEQKFWSNYFDAAFNGIINTWDFQWTYTCFFKNGLAIIPKSNLVSNIGYGLDATHTVNDSPYAELPTSDIWEIEHPPFVVRHQEADNYTFDYFFGGKSIKEGDNWYRRMREKLSAIKQKLKERSSLYRSLNKTI